MYDPTKAHYIVITVIIKNGDDYLLLKRAPHEKAFPNQWSVPGGKLETTDYKNRPKDTAHHWYNVAELVGIRETLEETGITIEQPKYLTSIIYERDDGIPTMIISMYAETTQREVILEKGHTAYAWVPLEKLQEYDLVDGIYEEFIMLDNHLKGKPLTLWKAI